MYIVEKSVAGNSPDLISECESFDAAVQAAREAGARGEPKKSGRNDWCFSGGSESVGYWITEQ